MRRWICELFPSSFFSLFIFILFFSAHTKYVSHSLRTNSWYVMLLYIMYFLLHVSFFPSSSSLPSSRHLNCCCLPQIDVAAIIFGRLFVSNRDNNDEISYNKLNQSSFFLVNWELTAVLCVCPTWYVAKREKLKRLKMFCRFRCVHRAIVMFIEFRLHFDIVLPLFSSYSLGLYFKTHSWLRFLALLSCCVLFSIFLWLQLGNASLAQQRW